MSDEQVVKITIQLGDRVIELTVEEAAFILKQLTELEPVKNKKEFVFVPHQIPVYHPVPVFFQTPQMPPYWGTPQITCQNS